MKPLVIFGAGGFAREVAALVRDINAVTPSWQLLGFIDDESSLWGRELDELPVLGGCDWLQGQGAHIHAVLGIGSPSLKCQLAKRLRPHVASFPTLVHPTVVRTPYLQLGEGVVITAGNILTTQIHIGDFAMLNLCCTVGHDTSLGDFVSVSPGCNVSGNVELGAGCDVGTGSKIIQGVRVGAWSIIGAGTVVNRDVPANCTVVGVPAKVIKERPAGWHIKEL